MTETWTAMNDLEDAFSQITSLDFMMEQWLKKEDKEK